MLSIMDPVELEGLVLFRDDEDPSKFFLLPDEPTIPVDEHGVPDFFFIKYLNDVNAPVDGAEVGGGYIQLRTVLTIAPARRARVVDALRAQLTTEKIAGKTPFGRPIVSTEPILADPVWTSGTVKLETFKVGDKSLVRSATETVPVDLAGALGASMNLQLDAAGTEIFWSSFTDFADKQIPILITYELTYRARVSANLTIHADRSTVLKQLWKRVEPRPYRYSKPGARWVGIAFEGLLLPELLIGLRSQYPDATAMTDPSKITGAIRSAVTSGDIEVVINTDQAGGETDAAKVQELLFKTAADVLSGRVIPAIFGEGDTTEPASEREDDAAVQKLVKVPLESESTTNVTFDMTLTSTSVVERPCNPNGPIHVLLGSRDAMAACFKQLLLTDGFFSLMRVTVATAGLSFERDGIDAIQVFLEYDEIDEANPDRPRVHRTPPDGCLLRSATDTFRWRFDTARAADGSHKRTYTFRTEVHYGDLIIKSTPARRSDAMLLINPAAMGALRVELAFTAPKDQVRSARVSLRYTKSSGEVIADEIDLGPDQLKKTWFRPTGEIPAEGAPLAAPPYTYQIVYQLGASQVEMPWATSRSDLLEVPGPFVKILTYVLHPRGSFDGVANLAGDLVYEDAAHDYAVTRSWQLDKLTATSTIEIPVMAGAPEEVSFTARINRLDGSSTELPPGRAAPGQLLLGKLVEEVVAVRVAPDLIDLDHEVQLAVVHLRYRDDDGAAQEKTLTFNKANKAEQVWSFSRSSKASPIGYDVDARFITYDRAKSFELHLKGFEDRYLLLDRQPT